MDLNRVVREVLGDLEVRVEKSGAKVLVGELPTLEADPMQMRQLFQNLIGNALKYRKDSEPPRVALSARRERSFWHFLVQDNGIGIEPQYHEQIFGLFKRLRDTGQLRPVSDLILARTLIAMLLGFVASEQAMPKLARVAMRLFPQRAWVNCTLSGRKAARAAPYSRPGSR